MRHLTCFLALFILMSSCKQTKKNTLSTEQYFDLNEFFDAQIKNLSSQNPAVYKNVSINGQKEAKQIKIDDWRKELDLFLSSDINKADWRGAFNKTVTDSTIIYNTHEDKIFVKKLELGFDEDENIQKVKIIIERNNLIYSSNDTLEYIPKTRYSIKKSQKIKLLSPRNYSVEGQFIF